MLPQAGEVRLGRALLCLGEPENSKNLGLGSPRRRGVEQNAEIARFRHFHQNSFDQNKSFRNKTSKLT